MFTYTHALSCCNQTTASCHPVRNFQLSGLITTTYLYTNNINCPSVFHNIHSWQTQPTNQLAIQLVVTGSLLQLHEQSKFKRSSAYALVSLKIPMETKSNVNVGQTKLMTFHFKSNFNYAHCRRYSMVHMKKKRLQVQSTMEIVT